MIKIPKKITAKLKVLVVASVTLIALRAAYSEESEKCGWDGLGLTSYDPNYFVIAETFSDGELAEDTHIEFYLSIAYPIALNTKAFYWPDRVIPVYNGLYDFYLFGDRYDSAPILSRRQNPGLVFEWNSNTDKVFRLGYFHESNGQTLNDSDGTGATDYQNELDRVDEAYALSQVSRGWDYLSARADFSFDFGEENKNKLTDLLLQLELRNFFDFQTGGSDSEEGIFWEPVTEQPRVREFDGIRLTAEHQFELLKADSSLRLELKTGIGGSDALQNWSYKTSLTWGIFHVFYFDGYGREPSSYHLRSEYAGFGVEFR